MRRKAGGEGAATPRYRARPDAGRCDRGDQSRIRNIIQFAESRPLNAKLRVLVGVRQMNLKTALDVRDEFGHDGGKPLPPSRNSTASRGRVPAGVTGRCGPVMRQVSRRQSTGQPRPCPGDRSVPVFHAFEVRSSRSGRQLSGMRRAQNDGMVVSDINASQWNWLPEGLDTHCAIAGSSAFRRAVA